MRWLCLAQTQLLAQRLQRNDWGLVPRSMLQVLQLQTVPGLVPLAMGCLPMRSVAWVPELALQ